MQVKRWQACGDLLKCTSAKYDEIQSAYLAKTTNRVKMIQRMLMVIIIMDLIRFTVK